jgi:hypothetical protein
MKNYHAQLETMLRILGKVQSGEDTRLKNVEVNLFGKQMILDVICPILFISVDTPAADKLCGHYSNYTGVIRHPTVSCDITVDQLDNPHFHCNAVTWNEMNEIATTGTSEQCTQASQHECINAFTDIEIGDPIHKIFGAVPTDTMHSVRKGFMSCATSIIFDCMTKKEKTAFDDLTLQFHKSHGSTHLMTASALGFLGMSWRNILYSRHYQSPQWIINVYDDCQVSVYMQLLCVALSHQGMASLPPISCLPCSCMMQSDT